jgi:hypothetical protein
LQSFPIKASLKFSR